MVLEFIFIVTTIEVHSYCRLDLEHRHGLLIQENDTEIVDVFVASRGFFSEFFPKIFPIVKIRVA